MSNSISKLSNFFKREKTYFDPYTALSKHVEDTETKIEKERKERIAEVVREKLSKGEITREEIRTCVEQQRNKVWVPNDSRSRNLLEWKNIDYFYMCLPILEKFAAEDCTSEKINIDHKHIQKCIKDLDTFLKTQDLKEQEKTLYEILSNLIFQQLLIEFFGSLGKANRMNYDLLYYHYNQSHNLYTSLDEHLNNINIQDPELYFPLLEFFNIIKADVHQIATGVQYNFERYFLDYRFIAALQNFKKNIPSEKEDLHKIIKQFLNLLKYKNNVEIINYVKISYFEHIIKYDEYYEKCGINLICKVPFLNKIYTFLDLCLSYRAACTDTTPNEKMVYLKANFFDSKLLSLRAHLLSHGEDIAKEYEKIKSFLNTFYVHCLKKFQSISKGINTLDDTPFQPSLFQNIPNFYSFDKIATLFKDEYIKIKKQNPSFEYTIPFSISSRKSSKTTKEIETDSSPSNENASFETVTLAPEAKDTIVEKISAYSDEEGEWREVPYLNVERFKKKCPFDYHSRVSRWFLHPFGESLPKSQFPEYVENSPHEQLKAQIFHSFPQEVDNYLKMGKEITDVGTLHPLKSGKEISNHCYRFIALPAEITHGEKVYFGLILYKIDTTKNLCIHRYFHQAASANELFTTFRISENILRIIEKTPENVSESDIKESFFPTYSPEDIKKKINRYSLIIYDPRGFNIQLFSTKLL